MTPFVCPKCGFKESPCWRTSRFVLYAVYCDISELKLFEPELAKEVEELRKRQTLAQGGYVYWKRGTVPHIYRVREDLKDFIGGDKVEKPKRPDLRQRKLVEETHST